VSYKIVSDWVLLKPEVSSLRFPSFKKALEWLHNRYLNTIVIDARTLDFDSIELVINSEQNKNLIKNMENPPSFYKYLEAYQIVKEMNKERCE